MITSLCFPYFTGADLGACALGAEAPLPLSKF